MKGDVRESIQENDVLNLRDTSLSAGGAELASPPSYDFLADPEKRERYQEWLDERQRDVVLETTNRDRIREGRAWHSSFIRGSYKKGLKHANTELRKQGYDLDTEDVASMFNKPVHQRKVEMLYLRAYDELDGITNAQSQAIGRILSDGMVEGHGPRKMASALNSEIDDIGIQRSRLMARTETVRAHNHGTLKRLDEMGVDSVTVIVESAGDRRTCPECESLDGNEYDIDDAYSVLPSHPGCRCTFRPSDI